jgi:carotenoid cleavage dioxygenase-like enzyme
VRFAAVDRRCPDSAPAHLFTVTTSPAGPELSRHDPSTGEVRSHAVGAGRVAGQPVLVPTPDGDVVLLPVEVVATREQELLVLDAADPTAGPVAVVRIPGGPRPGEQALWVNLGSACAD